MKGLPVLCSLAGVAPPVDTAANPSYFVNSRTNMLLSQLMALGVVRLEVSSSSKSSHRWHTRVSTKRGSNIQSSNATSNTSNLEECLRRPSYVGPATQAVWIQSKTVQSCSEHSTLQRCNRDEAEDTLHNSQNAVAGGIPQHLELICNSQHF